MIKLVRLAVLVALFSCGLQSSPANQDPAFDAVILLDNTLSMRTSDAHGAVKKTVADFVRQVGANARVELALFDEGVELLVPLREANPTAPVAVLKKVNYRGRFANLPAALERASYDLKSFGRPEVPKAIVIFTDSGIDTGDPLRDQTSANWVREEFARDASQHDIQVFAITLSEKADFQLLHTLATATHGDYVRAYREQELNLAVDKLRTQIGKVWPRRHVDKEAGAVGVGHPERESLVPHAVFANTGRFLVSPVGLAGLTVLAGLVAFSVGKKPVQAEPRTDLALPDGPVGVEPMPRAELRRCGSGHGYAEFQLKRPFTVVGRAPPLPNGKVGYLQLDGQSIGRCHALIEYRNGTFWLIDKKSRNGTYVNDERIENDRRLHHGDRVRFHHIEFEFALPDYDADETLVGNMSLEDFGIPHFPALTSSASENFAEAFEEPAAEEPAVVPELAAAYKDREPDLMIDDDEQSITRLLSQLNSGPIIDPEVIADSSADSSPAGGAASDIPAGSADKKDKNAELDALIRDYMSRPLTENRDPLPAQSAAPAVSRPS